MELHLPGGSRRGARIPRMDNEDSSRCIRQVDHSNITNPAARAWPLPTGAVRAPFPKKSRGLQFSVHSTDQRVDVREFVDEADVRVDAGHDALHSALQGRSDRTA